MKNEKGYSTLIVIIILTLSVMVGIAGLDLALSQQKNVKIGINKKLAFQIAEAGVNYYQWHLAHDPDDYQDDTGGPGPYVHDYKNATGEIIGQFSLEITPPPLGSTITTIRSTGYSTANPNNKKDNCRNGNSCI